MIFARAIPRVPDPWSKAAQIEWILSGVPRSWGRCGLLSEVAECSGKWEVFVTSFPEGHGKWQISNAGGNQPRWRAELYYMTLDSELVAMPVKSGVSFEAGTGAVLFQTYPREAALATSEQYFYDASRDGQKVLINALGDGAAVGCAGVEFGVREVSRRRRRRSYLTPERATGTMSNCSSGL